jgi:hypothetical protein
MRAGIGDTTSGQGSAAARGALADRRQRLVSQQGKPSLSDVRQSRGNPIEERPMFDESAWVLPEPTAQGQLSWTQGQARRSDTLPVL